MQWHELLNLAAQAEDKGDLLEAETYFDQAVQAAQTQLGPYDVNLAKCFLSFAQFLEGTKRYAEAQLRYRLAAGIFKQGGHSSSQAFASSKADQMSFLASHQQ